MGFVSRSGLQVGRRICHGAGQLVHIASQIQLAATVGLQLGWKTAGRRGGAPHSNTVGTHRRPRRWYELLHNLNPLLSALAMGNRNIVLIRHGHYNDKARQDVDAFLTAQGRQQARIMSQRVADMDWKPDRVIVSDMTRAKETHAILMQKLPDGTPTETIPQLREGRPCQPVPPSRSGIYRKAVVERDGSRIDEAFDFIFHRATPTQAPAPRLLFAPQGRVCI